MSEEHRHATRETPQPRSPTWWIFAAFAVIAGYFLIAEHTAHLYGWLSTYGIWLLLLACPLMHLFMHGGHGGHGGHRDHDDPRPNDRQKGAGK